MLSRTSVREIARVVFIATLALTAFATGRNMDLLRADVNTSTAAARTNAKSVEKVEQILADVCKAAPDKTVTQAGRTSECKLAEAGNIEQQVPVVQPQVRVHSAPLPREEIEAVVDAYLENRLRELPGQYRVALRQAVVDYLRTNPPPAGKDGKPGKDAPPPNAAQIAPVVAAYVAAHPPPAGKDGQDGNDGADGSTGAAGSDGVSVTNAALDGCDLVFTFSNETTVRVGPICGPAGRDGKDGNDGAVGKVGATGRGVASTNCVAGDDVDQNDDGTVAATDWLITYDREDAEGRTSERVDGPCRVEPSEGSGLSRLAPR